MLATRLAFVQLPHIFLLPPSFLPPSDTIQAIQVMFQPPLGSGYGNVLCWKWSPPERREELRNFICKEVPAFAMHDSSKLKRLLTVICKSNNNIWFSSSIEPFLFSLCCHAGRWSSVSTCVTGWPSTSSSPPPILRGESGSTSDALRWHTSGWPNFLTGGPQWVLDFDRGDGAGANGWSF